MPCTGAWGQNHGVPFAPQPPRRSDPKTAGSLRGNSALPPEAAWENKLFPWLLPSPGCFCPGTAQEPTVNTPVTAIRQQNHRISLGWKSPPRSSSPTPDTTAPCHPAHGTECHVQNLLNTSSDAYSATSLGSPFQHLIIFSVNKFFLISNLSLPWHCLRLYPLILSPAACKKRPTHSWLQSPVRWL